MRSNRTDYPRGIPVVQKHPKGGRVRVAGMIFAHADLIDFIGQKVLVIVERPNNNEANIYTMRWSKIRGGSWQPDEAICMSLPPENDNEDAT